MSSPYTPPTAPVRDAARPPGSPIKAVIYGVLVDVGGTFVTGSVLSIAYAMGLASEGMSPEQAAAALAKIPLDSWVSIAGMIFGCLFSVAGGYVCARVARKSEYKLGATVAAVGVLIGVFFGGGQYSAGVFGALLMATVVSVMVGAHLGATKNAGA